MTAEREKCALIMPRRNFLIRALGFTAAGATVAVPLVTMDSAEKRYRHHLKGVGEALRDMFPGQYISLRGNIVQNDHALYQERFARGEDHTACAIFMVTGTDVWGNGNVIL